MAKLNINDKIVEITNYKKNNLVFVKININSLSGPNYEIVIKQNPNGKWIIKDIYRNINDSKNIEYDTFNSVLKDLGITKKSIDKIAGSVMSSDNQKDITDMTKKLGEYYKKGYNVLKSQAKNIDSKIDQSIKDYEKKKRIERIKNAHISLPSGPRYETITPVYEREGVWSTTRFGSKRKSRKSRKNKSKRKCRKNKKSKRI